MILAKNEILKEIKQKTIKVSPYNKNNLGPASYDLTLSDEFRVFSHGKVVDIKETTDYRKYTILKKAKSYLLKPSGYVLGITKETITLPENICGWLSGRSRFARLGLAIHITANFVSPGISNKQVLEIRNLGTMPLKLHAGQKVCQMIFERMDGEGKYKGKFKNQKSV